MSNQNSNPPAQTDQGQPEGRALSPRGANLVALRTSLENATELQRILPAHIPVERFKRVINTAVVQNPDLLDADPRELFNAAMKAASDGLLPDGREGALVTYNTKVKGRDGERDRWIKKPQWMPMIAGILKKVRNSGELSSIVARVVYGGDKFRNWIDDAGEHIEYEAADNQDRDIVRCVFAMAKLKDGSIEVEVLRPADIEQIRSASKSRDSGPWVQWWDEMSKKSALRRLTKRLPMSTDLDDLIRRDDALYDLDGAADNRRALPGAMARGLAGRLDAVASAGTMIAHDPLTGEIDDQGDPQGDAGDRRDPAGQTRPKADPKPETPQKPKPSSKPQPPAADQGRDDDPRDQGRDADGPGDDAQQDNPAPTAAERQRMEHLAELKEIATRKAQKGARALKLWRGGLDDDDQKAVDAMKDELERYFPAEDQRG